MENGELIMELTDVMASKIKELFDIEIEMLQGTTEKLPDGRTRYTLKIEAEEKAELIKKFAISAMFQKLSGEEKSN